jgi:hypothetical protein
MRPTRLGAAAHAAVAAGGEGTVVAWFPRACYVSLPAGLIAVVAEGVPNGPIHVVLDSEPVHTPRGAPARVVDGDLEIDGQIIVLADAEPWRGTLPSAAEVASNAEDIAVATQAARGSALLVEPYRARADRARELLAAGALVDAARVLVGVGPGLTPSGDDALAGIVFALRARAGPIVESATARAAEAGETGAISREFLRWAARGQALEPAHDLLVRATNGDARGASLAARRMNDVGETSGADFLLGLRWGIEAAPQLLRSPAAAHNRR